MLWSSGANTLLTKTSFVLLARIAQSRKTEISFMTINRTAALMIEGFIRSTVKTPTEIADILDYGIDCAHHFLEESEFEEIERRLLKKIYEVQELRKRRPNKDRS